MSQIVISLFKENADGWCNEEGNGTQVDNSWAVSMSQGAIVLTIPMLIVLSSKNKDAKIFENHLNPVMLVTIR